MRSACAIIPVCVILFGIPAWCQQGSQNAAASQTASDPQAVAVVQAAITAFGGATAISQAQSWTFQAQTQGPHSNGNIDYVISTDTDTGKLVRADGTTKAAPLIHSHFVPALVAVILLKQSQDPRLTLQFGGTSTINSKPTTTIIFNSAVGQSPPLQIWTFDATNLPVTVDFRAPAIIGGRQSFPFVVLLDEYRQISGVMYPFQMNAFVPGKPSEVVSIQSLASSATAAVNEFNSTAGDLR